MAKDSTPPRRGKPRPAQSAYCVGDTVVFKYEGNVRARVEGQENVGGEPWIKCRAEVDFLVPPANVVGFELEEE
jgi:hypothetical protein